MDVNVSQLTAPAGPPSANERIKTESRALRGTIAEGLAREDTGALADDDQQLIKFHGMYLQDDRDLRAERGRQRMEKAFSFMARMRIPGGILTPAQWLVADTIGRERGNGTLRLTTRQTIQFHGIIKSNVRPALRAMHAAMLDTIAACGDVNRNVIATVVPWRAKAHAQIAQLADAISSHLLPKSRAWHEIWIGDECVAGAAPEEEPIYGKTYLPRKFKIAIALPPHNDVDVFAQDLGFIAIEEDGAIVGYNVVAGGGMGMTHGEPETYPRNGDVIGFCRPDEAVAVAEAVVTVQRDLGNRSNRKQARLKYTIDRIGLDVFVAAVNARLTTPLAPARAFGFTASGDRLGWIDGDDGRTHYALFVENGRVRDDGERRLLSGLRAVAGLGVGRFVITANQNLVLAGIPRRQKRKVAALLAEHGLDTGIGELRRNAMACVALPTCGLSLAEAERALPWIITRLETELTRAGLAGEPITIRMTGCPNGCARPYMAEIGLVGRGPGQWNLYLGGAHDASRLSKLHRRDLDEDGIVSTLGALFAAYAQGREAGEHFGDWVIRAGIVRQTVTGLDFHANLSPELGS